MRTGTDDLHGSQAVGHKYVSFIGWISNTLSQGYTYLQSLVKCLDHKNIVSDTVCNQAKVVLGCAISVSAGCINDHAMRLHILHIARNVNVIP